MYTSVKCTLSIFRMSRIVGMALIFLAISSASAQNAARPGNEQSPIWTPPHFWKFDDNAPTKPTVPKEMITNLRVGDVTIPLEENSELQTLQSMFGGKIGVEGDAADYFSWLCLYGSDAIGTWVLWLESGEIDGPYVGGFQWRRVSRASRFDERCSQLDETSEVKLPIDLGLGSTEAKVIEILGRPTSRRANTLLYEHQHDEFISGEQFTSFNTVIVVLRRGVVYAIQAEKTTTN
jgi:hypothetical protein